MRNNLQRSVFAHPAIPNAHPKMTVWLRPWSTGAPDMSIIATSNLSGHFSSSSTSLALLHPYHPPKDYHFPSRKFGKENFERSCQASWFSKYKWLDYDCNKDLVFCFVCKQAYNKGLSVSSHGEHCFSQ